MYNDDIMKEKLSVAFLWHMHQPLYKDLLTGEYHLPWVRLHATHSYLDMARILEDFPLIKCTFNLTPTLISQIMDISDMRPENDKYLRLSMKDAATLTADEKYFILRNFFSRDPGVVAPISKRYGQLLLKRGNNADTSRLRGILNEFNESDFRDIQVLFNLLWCGFTLRNEDPLIRVLFEKGEGFTENEKKALIRRQKEAALDVLPLYKKLQDEGQIEISTTPFYHPILPLLYGRDNETGFQWKEDARWHIKKAVEFYKEIFGRAPAGMWPAEGSVNNEVVPLFAENGIKWIASDENVLLDSLKNTSGEKSGLKFNAYTAGKIIGQVAMVFRDRGLSDAISFQFRDMTGEEAARDLHGRLGQIRKSDAKNNFVAIILDGENPWIYYKDGGRAFLSELYRLLGDDNEIETVTIGDYVAEHKTGGNIKDLAPGSWIDREFSKWRGSPEKDKAWKYLEKAREDIFAFGDPPIEAMEELYIAESSDWFWWYDDPETEYNVVFDDIFRMHIANIYKLIGAKVPGYVGRSIRKG